MKLSFKFKTGSVPQNLLWHKYVVCQNVEPRYPKKFPKFHKHREKALWYGIKPTNV